MVRSRPGDNDDCPGPHRWLGLGLGVTMIAQAPIDGEHHPSLVLRIKVRAEVRVSVFFLVMVRAKVIVRVRVKVRVKVRVEVRV